MRRALALDMDEWLGAVRCCDAQYASIYPITSEAEPQSKLERRGVHGHVADYAAVHACTRTEPIAAVRRRRRVAEEAGANMAAGVDMAAGAAG